MEGASNMKSILQNPDYWRERAEETRTKAESFRIDKAQKQKLLKLAEEYDRLARYAEQWRYADELQPL
jgi:hypothetical protein